jgi:hypothetical protein
VANKTYIETISDTTPVLVSGARIANGYEQSICLEWLTGSDVFIGGADVATSGTTAIGKKINASRTEWSVKTSEPLYVRIASGTATVHVFRTLG